MRNNGTQGRRTTLALSALSALLVVAGLASSDRAQAAVPAPSGVTRPHTAVDTSVPVHGR